ncbi:MAG: cobalt transporter CbiM [Acidobacteriota bacterium]
MHIPDGYLGPATCLAAFGAMVPFWSTAAARLKRTLHLQRVPLLALGAAFTFLVMMFNVPIPGGTTGHAVGSVLVAVLLGPWAAVVAVSVSLLIQALLFGDGGITALGANCLTMAVVMPFTGWWVYRLLAGGAAPDSRRRALAAAAGGYVGLNAAALAAALLFGIQPALAHDAAGRALYCPFPLSVSVPAMAVEHLLLFGFVEATVTGLVVAVLGRTDPELLREPQKGPSASPATPRWKRWALALLVAALLTPLGLALPSLFGAGDAWGEWGSETLAERSGYVPTGLQRLEGLWRAPMPDYAPPGGEEASLLVQSLWYIVSAVAGAVLVGGAAWGLRRLLGGRESHGPSP